MDIRPGDLVTSLKTQWVWSTPTLWRIETGYTTKFTVEHYDVALVLARIKLEGRTRMTCDVVLLATRGMVGWMSTSDVKRC